MKTRDACRFVFADEVMFEFQSENYPRNPGVYLFKDMQGKIIYIGKANDLRKRLSSYFRPLDQLPGKTRVMLGRIENIDYLCTNTEKEALLLEASLIKKHKPKYNIVLRDDKSYILFKLDKTQDYPRLSLTRTVARDGSVYFGPFTSANSARETLKFINNYFPLVKCKDTVFKNRTRPCLQYYINRCLAPCVYQVSIQEYRKYVRQVELFLEQGSSKLLGELNREMQQASNALQFEQAARIRDRIHAIKKTVEQQTVVLPEGGDMDIIGISRQMGSISIGVLFIRQGKLLDSKTFSWDLIFEDDLTASCPAKGTEAGQGKHGNSGSSRDTCNDSEDEYSEVVRNFLIQFYVRGRFIPESIVLPEKLFDSSIKEVLTERRGKGINIHTPEGSKEKNLMQMAESNAFQRQSRDREEDILASLRRKLHLKSLPCRIEAIDASHLSGTGVVVGQVVFENAVARKDSYRIYKFPELKDSFDDYAALSGWVERRIRSGPPWPDLVVIDGGKGQLNAVARTIQDWMEHTGSMDSRDFKAGHVDSGSISWEIVAISKGESGVDSSVDKVFLPERKNPVNLRSGEKELLFLQNIRDNVHRFVLSKQKGLRKQDTYVGTVATLEGIGPKTAQKLWSNFNSVQEMKQASLDTLQSMQGIGEKKARKIQSALQKISTSG
ncbi:MAG: excinuclease ABC subunit UvrC [Thermodesulfobacteriota bacterium]